MTGDDDERSQTTLVHLAVVVPGSKLDLKGTMVC